MACRSGPDLRSWPLHEPMNPPSPSTRAAPARPVRYAIGLAVPWRQAWPLQRQLLALLVVHVLVWTWAGVASRSNLDLPGDMVEAYAWAQGWQAGYYKHPPLSAWVTGLWFSVVPEGHLGYALLAAVNSALGLAGLALLAREFLPGRWVLMAVAVASLTPGITTLAMRFNANAILISTWPWAMALFVRLMHRGRSVDALLCGAACAAAMLGKYYSAVLLLTLLAAALWLPHWRAQLLRRPFALAVGCFVLLMAPHTLWLLAQTAGPLQYAQAATGTGAPSQSVLRALHFAFAHWVFPALAVCVFWTALVGPARHRSAFAALLAPLRPRGDEAWLLAAVPVVATMIGTVLTGARTAWVWGLPISAAVALLLATRARDAGADLDLRRLWRALALLWLLVACLAPTWWWVGARSGSAALSEPREELAAAVDQLWRQVHDGPLPAVSGTRALAASVSFYAPSHPRYWSLWNAATETPWVDLDAVERSGALLVCADDDHACADLAAQWTSDERTLTVAKTSRGLHFEPRRYRVFMLPPAVLPTL